MAVEGTAASMSSPPGGWPKPRSLYVHVPFCRHRCGYCNFSVIAGRDDLQDRFLKAVEVELDRIVGSGTVELDTLYFGGGTPTQLSPDRLEQLLQVIRQRVHLVDNAEVTCEANPEDVSDETIDVLVRNGVNRVSLGVQSFHDAKLQVLQRGHNREQAIAAIEQMCAAIGNVSIDLIFGAPVVDANSDSSAGSESLDLWQSELAMAVSLPITHVSTYSLTYEKGTQFWSRRRAGELHEVPEDTDIAMYRACRRSLAGAGLEQYEISSFAKPSFRSRHNQAYWNGYGWYAIGPGAASFEGGVRSVNHRSPTTYLKQILEQGTAVAESEIISVQQHARELAAFGLRQIDGIDLTTLNQRVGFDFAAGVQSVITEMRDSGLLVDRADRAQLTPRGLLLADFVEMKILELDDFS